MSLVLGCVAPHPPVLVPEVGGEDAAMVASTAAAMKELAERVRASKPDVLVVISPHSTGFFDSIAVKVSPNLSGSFFVFGAWEVALDLQNDIELAGLVMEEAESAGIPVVGLTAGYAALTRKEDLDHGVLVPLYYIFRDFKVPIVSLAVSHIGFEKHYELGGAVRRAVERSGRRAIFLASGDLSHKLTPDAPAGFSADAKDFDELVVEIFRSGELDRLANIDPGFAESAGECGLRSFITLAGAFEGKKVETKVLSYEGPFGVGYLVATVGDGGYHG